MGEGAIFVEGNAGDKALVTKLAAEHGVDAIIHFAGSIVVPDSVAEPLAYYANNTVVARNLMEAAIQAGVKNFIFSSTATVYAGESRPSVRDIADGARQSLWPFQADDGVDAQGCGAGLRFPFRGLALFQRRRRRSERPHGTIEPTRHASDQTRLPGGVGRVPQLDIFGTDYPTPDGTGVRDYIHVSDLVAAHALALDYLRDGGQPAVMNCGYGHGSSVREVIKAIERGQAMRFPCENPRAVPAIRRRSSQTPRASARLWAGSRA